MSALQQVAPMADDLTLRDLEVQGAEGPLPARLYLAGTPGTKRDTLVVFFHGGGFVGGTIDEADDFLSRLVSADPGQVALSAAYTLASQKPFPAAVEDAHAVLLWAKKNKAKLAWNGKRMVVAGIEAGANLAAVVSLMSRDRGGPPLAGQVLIMPMLDPALSTCSMRELPMCRDKAAVVDKVAGTCAAGYRGYLPNAADRTHPYASPLQSSRLKNLPPALILSAEDDPLRDEAEQYGAKLIKCGITTTVKRLPPPPLEQPGGRNDCACVFALTEIAAFIRGADGTENPPA
ncbi:acetyl esterase/lipase [Pseudoduganella flava]|uniref:Acetyl esterase/lipase n=1 Tax=Pseudoduganella flava TaxID=871742 RepID=A0A562PGN6_9BURK|nr:alpha/beta hydrolase [Pseudoduganella flava]QGZ42496.1 alpha/beta hydrolase fold domain-containing protein [Pseudoduganella flava]TWI43642.1 acetyl esterase/lipase [Pseudoduganella flava]